MRSDSQISAGRLLFGWPRVVVLFMVMPMVQVGQMLMGVLLSIMFVPVGMACRGSRSVMRVIVMGPIVAVAMLM